MPKKLSLHHSFGKKDFIGYYSIYSKFDLRAIICHVDQWTIIGTMVQNCLMSITMDVVVNGV